MTESTREGRLVATTDGRLAVQPGGRPLESLYGLHCGDGLELWINGHYVPGRVENAPRTGWYWTDNLRSVPLQPGMKARGYTG